MQQRYNFLFVSNKLYPLPSQPMRFFAAIMSIILIAQIFIPCADKARAAVSGKVLITQATQQQKDSNDDCPPLCYCVCCSSVSVVHSLVSLHSVNSSNLLLHVSEYLPKPIQKVSIPIWQPPRL